jgi:hypothetical protein
MLRFYQVEILISIRSLTATAPRNPTSIELPSDKADYFQATCFKIQQQLETLKSKTVPATIEESCILSALIYIDTTLLDTPPEVLLKSTANGQLQQAIMQSRSTQDLEENEEIFEWISSTATIGISSNRRLRANLVDKFNAALWRLKELYIR